MGHDGIAGAIGGLVATIPMTAAMTTGFYALPHHQRMPLPPRQITARTAGHFLPWSRMSHSEKKVATLAAHYAYGAAAGTLYGTLAPRRYQNATIGVVYGLAVWSASYLGLLPSLNILRPATRHPAERNLLMIAAHAVWGAALGHALSRYHRR